MRRRRLLELSAGAVGVAVLLALVAGASFLRVQHLARSVPPDPTPTPIALLRQPIPPGPDAALLERGRALAIAGDCVSCHTRIGGRPFEGGLGLQTPYGVIFSANITGGSARGLGDWTADEFWRLMSEGIGRHGKHVYAAMPYNYYTRIARTESDAILAYLKTIPGSQYQPPDNLLPIPMNFRPVLIGWNLLFLESERFRPDPAKGADWNRGAELVEGLGHCGACHTPMNLAGAPERARFLHGAVLNGWLAPDLTGNPRTGLGRWSAAEIVEYLKTGRNAHANASGPMGEVVSYSTSLMPEADLSAIATYLKSIPASPDRPSPAPDPGVMRRGAAIYTDACSACHLSGGRGQAGIFPRLPANAVAQQQDAAGLIRIILGGARTGPTPRRPSPLTMPSFAWKLTDEQVADVATYVRNSWGNRASPVAARDVERARVVGRFSAPIAKPMTGGMP